MPIKERFGHPAPSQAMNAKQLARIKRILLRIQKQILVLIGMLGEDDDIEVDEPLVLSQKAEDNAAPTVEPKYDESEVTQDGTT